MFLDEVAELSQAAQVKLLRVLQEGTIEPLGSDRTLDVDVRIVAATHRDLRKEIAAGVPRGPLLPHQHHRARHPAAARAHRGSARPGEALHPALLEPADPTAGLTWRAWTALEGYAFPGNVRELMHAVEHAVLLSGGGQIDFEHLPSAIVGMGRRPTAANGETMLPLADAMKAFERSYLLRTLADFEGKKAVTAESLGISRKSLWEKLRNHGVEETEGASRARLT